MVKKTRKINRNKAAKNTKKSMTIPQLRRAFDHIDAYVAKESPSVDNFCKEWKKVFGKEVSKSAASEYLQYMGSHKKQRGGSQSMTPAPLGYEMRAGLDNYGSFPEYISGGFGFANKDSLSSACGNEDISPRLLPATGSNLVGGRRNKKTRKIRKHAGGGWADTAAEFVSRPFTAVSAPLSWTSPNPSIPPSIATGLPSMGQDMQMMAKGYATNANMPSPRPEIPSFNLVAKTPIYSAYNSPASRIV